MAAQPLVQQALLVAAMEYYLFDSPAGTSAFFSVGANGVSFTYDRIENTQYALKSPRLLEDAVLFYLSTEEKAAVTGRLSTENSWHVQIGTGGMTWTAAAAAYDVAIGGAQSDFFDGGAGDDILIGGAGQDNLSGGTGNDTLIGGVDADVLNGGANNDRLFGGQGSDTYYFTGSFGKDTIFDSDGSGSIYVDGLKLTGGSSLGQGAYLDAGTGWGYSAVGGDLVIRRDGSTDTIIVQGWQPGQLGITLTAGSVTPPPGPDADAEDADRRPGAGSRRFDRSHASAARQLSDRRHVRRR